MDAREIGALLRAHDQLESLARKAVFAETDTEYHRLVNRIRSRLKRLGPDFDLRFREAVAHITHRHA